MAIIFRVVMGLAMILLVAGTLVSGEQDKCCRFDVMMGLQRKCWVYMAPDYPDLPKKLKPSTACCDAVKTVDAPCFCSQFTEDMEGFFDVNKAVNVAAFCGKPLTHGSKCGSFTVP